MVVFAGATNRQKLASGRAAAKAVLLKYVPELKFDVEAARDTMSQVEGWIERNRGDLAEALAGSGTTLPRHLCIAMGNAYEVQQWIIANYTVAAAGLGPWMSGSVDRLVADPESDVTALWANQDAQMRLNIFAMIIKLDRDGELAKIFNPPEDAGPTAPCGGFGAFGIAPLAVIIIIAAVVLAAVVVYMVLDSRRVQRNNDLLEKICLDAQKAGDQATVDACISALKDIQVASPFGDVAGEIGKVLLVLGGGYLAFAYGVPAVLKWVEERRKTPARRLGAT